ncbi:RagB/SusD family nutrient uptake outer membrane protein [Myroides marinus]|uniref:RagB/SusD family nutrient uptake outer membrane protein n=1 Tax=Myroides marinus TaxID=703342 RepID=UPI002578EC97|nr:RagB/SusD family nutrient uptake outer membrane protein [Myroides marinus]MDM1346310.1 RagB/SusD family nutrient uptake outer membrane protein [Myroides marinus]MDM1351094.1 RagB/SusD family nutrient uptake outer membrane protein [Myroides marinus]MDM1353909.1 RagB/SusD family nutrient uptake outer membrane protein [Myroides marinus]MDM1358265.1 RagB/SusD family nutrient uptake outer membrane protein [Myroides marinus]MDM1365499.1 RagB/SusD family nutrient uptake outer membrane protein [Myr
MKIQYIKYALLTTVFALGSCSDDYLETIPTNQTSPENVFKTTETIAMAINGLAKIMTTQHIGQGYNGEGTIKLYFGEYPGNNFRKDVSASIANLENIENTNSSLNAYPWHYYYMLITNANEIIAKVDGADGPANDKKYLKAQALAYRSFAYTMLVQIYGNRWIDSNNGETKSVVLRLSPSDSKELPLSPLKDVYTQIYKDLDLAIQLFNESAYKRDATKNYFIDASVAHAIYARAALNRQDYTVALKEAGLAKKDYPLMSTTAYKAGFANPTSEWIWSSYGAADEQLHYFSYGAYMGYNSNAGAVRNTPSRISKEFFETLSDSDIRKGLFIDPTGYPVADYNEDTGLTVTKSQFNKDIRAKYPDIQGDAKTAAYMQVKVKNNVNPGVMHLNHFRSSEMFLIEAEALHFLGRDGESAKVLEALTKGSGRDVNYTCTKVGKDLFNEIVKYRGIELWGEGFDWFDYKRWNLTIEKKMGSQGGNASPTFAKTFTPEMNNKWTWRIPKAESDYNPNI